MANIDSEVSSLSKVLGGHGKEEDFLPTVRNLPQRRLEVLVRAFSLLRDRDFRRVLRLLDWNSIEDILDKGLRTLLRKPGFSALRGFIVRVLGVLASWSLLDSGVFRLKRGLFVAYLENGGRKALFNEFSSLIQERYLFWSGKSALPEAGVGNLPVLELDGERKFIVFLSRDLDRHHKVYAYRHKVARMRKTSPLIGRREG